MGAVLYNNENQLEKRQTVDLYCPGQHTVVLCTVTVQQHDCTQYNVLGDCTGSYFTGVGVRPSPYSYKCTS